VLEKSNLNHGPLSIGDILSKELQLGPISFERFMQICLYDPLYGYYVKPRKRIGYGEGTDFYTSSTSQPIFAELIIAACTHLLGSEMLSHYTFIELGAEPNQDNPSNSGGILNGIKNPFKASLALGVKDHYKLSGPSIIFSNELFDAQPFKRFRFSQGRWKELGVACVNNTLKEVEISSVLPNYLPAEAEEGYHIDSPEMATSLLEGLVSQPWTGLFIACDYGKSWDVLEKETPQGTARAYYQHTQSNNLLDNPSDQDLTCHICWDWLRTVLEKAQFKTINLQTQESFFVKYCSDWISTEISKEAGSFSPRKRALMQLIHPAHLGAKFQILNASRT